jgi:hypothetical protein
MLLYSDQFSTYIVTFEKQYFLCFPSTSQKKKFVNQHESLQRELQIKECRVLWEELQYVPDSRFYRFTIRNDRFHQGKDIRLIVGLINGTRSVENIHLFIHMYILDLNIDKVCEMRESQFHILRLPIYMQKKLMEVRRKLLIKKR